MATLEELLEEERIQFVNTEALLRQFAFHVRGLEPIPSDAEIEQHLSTCKDYYEIYGTREGVYSPWCSAGRCL